MNINAITRAVDVCQISGYVDPLSFAGTEVSFGHDVSARQDTFDISLTPYLEPVLEQWDFRGKGHREVVVMAVEQTGKSLSWQLGLVWSFVHEPCLSLVAYPSDDKCDEVNRSKLMPLMKSIPSLAASLAAPRAKSRNRYHFPAFVSYFQGAGTRISAHSARIRVADEVDDWFDNQDQAKSRKLDDLRKRGRVFEDSMLAIVSSPKGESPLLYGEFERTSKGFWHLRCQKCGDLTIRSCDVGGNWLNGEVHGGLQFETIEDERGRKRLVPGSERLICPVCEHQHEYSACRELNLQGGYIHEAPELVGRRTGFQWGALASQWSSLDWSFIAETQLLAGRSGDIRDQSNFDNSVRGLPFKSRPRGKDGQERRDLLAQHCIDPPDPSIIEGVFLTVDTQDNGWRWELRGLGVDSNRYQLGWGDCEYLEVDADLLEKLRKIGEAESAISGEAWVPPVSLEDVLNAGWGGLEVVMAIIDEGGHRKKEVCAFVETHPRVFSYKGGWQGGFDLRDPWTWSKNQEDLILARRPEYQDRLLWYLHEQTNRDNNFWFLMPESELTEEYFDEVLAVQEDPRKKEGNLRRNWTHNGRVHDYFDTGMMYLVLEDVAIAELDPDEWQHNKADIILRAYDEEDEAVGMQLPDGRRPWVTRWR